MGLLTADERNTLVDLLLRLPGIISPDTRQALIGSLPLALQQSVSLSRNARNDIRLLVDVVDGDGAQLADGRWPIELVMRRVIGDSEGLQLALDMKNLLDKALARVRAPADIAGGPAAPLTLSGPQLKEFQEALLSAFVSYSALSQMVFFGLGVSLDQITGTRQLRDAVFDVITWARANDRTEELIRAAREANTGNGRLRAFAQQVLPA